MNSPDITASKPDLQQDDSGAFLDGLTAIVGAANVELDLPERVFFSTDTFMQGTTAEIVVAPGSLDELSRAVAWCTGNGRYVVPRGGGFSYTQGYTPVREQSVSFDMRRMESIVEINTEDLWVKVEAGAKWKPLYDALKDLGYRTTYFGPMSGFHSTIGGAMSQGSFFFGTAQYGSTADSVLAIEVVLADGTVVTTGSAGATNTGSPFMRAYGPDLTGLFLHDSGALGIKSAVYMRLIPFPNHTLYASFAFDDQADGLAAMSAVGRQSVASECYLYDQYFVNAQRAQATVASDFKFLKGVVQSGSSRFAGLKDAAKLALSGRTQMKDINNILNIVVDDYSEEAARLRLDRIRAIVAELGGGEVEPNIPRTIRGTPFPDFKQMAYRDQTIRNLPINGLLPHSMVREAARRLAIFFAERKAVMDAHGVNQGTISVAVGSTFCSVEPLLFWKDEQLAAHDRLAERSDLDKLAQFQERPAAAALVVKLRTELVALFAELGAAHVQIGKAYPYAETRQKATFDLLKGVKHAVDPHGFINPGALGLAQG